MENYIYRDDLNINCKNDFRTKSRLPDFVLVFTAEVITKRRAMKLVKEKGFNKTLIYTDCNSGEKLVKNVISWKIVF